MDISLSILFRPTVEFMPRCNGLLYTRIPVHASLSRLWFYPLCCERYRCSVRSTVSGFMLVCHISDIRRYELAVMALSQIQRLIV